MQRFCRVALFAGAIVLLGSEAHALVVCAKDDGSGMPKPKSKLSLATVCTPGKQVEIGIAITGTVGVDAKVQIYNADLDVSAGDIGLTGGNLQVTSGSGTTGGAVNGKGNIIVGYNEGTGVIPQTRTGSHNLIVGIEHEYTSFGGVVAGEANRTSQSYATVSGGYRNTASGSHASVTGGYGNTASGSHASISGGYENAASSDQSSVSGGYQNHAGGLRSTVSGGFTNSANGPWSSVTGGDFNTVTGTGSCIGGGSANFVSNSYQWHAKISPGFPTGTDY
jgi:hypothetical protein